MSIIVEDFTAVVTFVVFGRLVVELIGIPTYTLVHSSRNKVSIPSVVTKTYITEKMFQVVLDLQVVRLFRVVQIFIDDGIILSSQSVVTLFQFQGPILTQTLLSKRVNQNVRKKFDLSNVGNSITIDLFVEH